MPLKIDVTKRIPTGHSIALEGSLDSTTYEQFEKTIEPMLGGGTPLVVIDMAKLSYVSSAGLRVIFRLWKDLTSHKRTFAMVNLQPQVKTVFDIMGALPKEGVFASIDELDAYLDTVQKQETEKQKKA